MPAPESDEAPGSGDLVPEDNGIGTEVVQEPGAGIESPGVEIACPSCGYLQPAPSRTRRCPACHETIVVRQVEGRTAYLTEAAVVTFEAERAREAREQGWETARARWLGMAATLGASAARQARLASAEPSAAGVTAARTLYLRAADQLVRGAKRDGRWSVVAQVRRAQAAAWYEDLGSPVPPPEDVVELHRDGMLAVLRGYAEQGADVELVGSTCCRACRADDGKAFKIAHELREPRLPHPDCPRGLCPCDWFVGVVEKKRRRRRPPQAGGPAI